MHRFYILLHASFANIYFFRRFSKIAAIMSNITAAAYEDSLCIEKWLFLFFWFYSSFVFVYKGVDIILSDFHIVLHRLDLIK